MNYKKEMEQIKKAHKTSPLWIILLTLLAIGFMILTNESKTSMVLEANASEVAFHLEPPRNNNWNIQRAQMQDDSPKVLEMYHHSPLQEAIMNRMYAKYPDKDMLYTFKQECGNVSTDCVSSFTGFDGNRAYGVCQLYYTFHKNFINSPDFKDWRKQADYCVDVWKKAKAKGPIGNTFHAYGARMQHAKYFKFK